MGQQRVVLGGAGGRIYRKNRRPYSKLQTLLMGGGEGGSVQRLGAASEDVVPTPKN